MPQRDPRRLHTALAAVVLLAAVVFVYHGVGGFEFVNFDDPDYLTRNQTVQGGLSWRGVWWAFSNFHAANWHPLTWLSHMADVSVFGSAAGGHHLVNLGLHAANTLLLFGVLRALTGSFWRSLAVAAIFAVHPAQVEAVAWVAERKTVLAALAGLLTVRAYLGHLARPAQHSFLAVVLLFAVGLLAKPMLVILPLLLLLLDWWPLGRFERGSRAPGTTRSPVVEKLPLFALALLSGLVTIAAQSHDGGVATLQRFPLPVRMGNALLSGVAYLGELALPRDLTVFYPHPSENLPWVRAALAALALAAVTYLAWRGRRAAPFAAFGWAWFLVGLLPVIGLLQVGAQARADRYLYLPLIGIFLAGAWAAAEFTRRRPRTRVPLSIAIAAAVVVFAIAAELQAGYWRDSRTLWEHALAVDPTSEKALYQLSEHERSLGNFAAQAGLLRKIVRTNPRHERAANNLLIARYRLGERPEALLEDYRSLLAINPKNAKALQNYGYLLIEAGRHREAVEQLQLAVAAEPGYCTAINNLGRAYLAAGDKPRARRSFERAVSCDPKERKFRDNLDLTR